MDSVHSPKGAPRFLARHSKWLAWAVSGLLYCSLFTPATAQTAFDLRFPNWDSCPKWSGQLIMPLLVPSASDREQKRQQLEREKAEFKPDRKPRPETAEERELRERISQSIRQNAPSVLNKLVRDCPEVAADMLSSPTLKRQYEREKDARYVEILELRDRLSAASRTDGRLLELQRQLEEANRRLEEIEFRQHLGR